MHPTQHYSPETYKARSSVGYLIKRAAALGIECIEPAIEARGFTFTQWVVLMYLRDGLAFNAKEICLQLRHDSGAVTRLIDQLEAREFVRRERSVDDRREVKLILTDAGREMVELLIPTVVERLNFMLRDFSAGEVSELTRLLHKFIGGFGAAGNTGDGAGTEGGE
ncbi:MAG TPA: MarR family transcriptional regulator [Steroidobacteraceae bacterium]|jgi:DNA-binding MarR family transcriptional regulator|nr:MarR family transcriptional regulator [Steroidobacteraceae bacterium]